MTRALNLLDGKTAAAMLLDNPESVVFPIGLFVLQFGLTATEFRAEAASGRLITRGEVAFEKGRPIGFKNIHVTAAAALSWLNHPKTPQKFKDHFDQMAAGCGKTKQ